MAAKKTRKKSRKPASPKRTPAPKKPVNKSAFVRSLPKTMPGAEVVRISRDRERADRTIVNAKIGAS